MEFIQQIRHMFLKKPIDKKIQEFDKQKSFVEMKESLASFSIVPKVYEAILDEKYGIVLRTLKNGEPTNFKGDLKKNVSFNGGYSHPKDKIKKRILKKYKSIPGFCSMSISTIDELLKHIKIIHEISYSHYVWAKETNLEGLFPNSCCGSSSRNVFLTLMDKGYPNATYVCNSKFDHAYVTLPFLLKEGGYEGFVVVDPTSDQLFNDKTTAPRNNLFIALGDKWVYETNWESGNNLYPSPEDNSTFANLHTLRNHLSSSINEQIGIEEYFTKVFKKSVTIKINHM